MLLRTTLLGGIAALALAAPAAADSLVYIKGHNVWVAAPDGSQARALTRDGSASDPYRSPTQADDGTIAVGHEDEIVRLNRAGKVLSRFTGASTTDSAGGVIGPNSIREPAWVDLSPDGRHVAYGYASFSCPSDIGCATRTVVLTSDAARRTAAGGVQRGLTHPSWVADDRLLAFGGFGNAVNVVGLGGSDNDAVHWFDPAEGGAVDGELSRDGRRIAYMDGAVVVTAAVTAGVGAGVPTPECRIDGVSEVADPTWSPDAQRLAYATPEGVNVATLPGADCAAASDELVLAGATDPDWGPASPAKPAAAKKPKKTSPKKRRP
jgi:hypothetical protein